MRHSSGVLSLSLRQDLSNARSFPFETGFEPDGFE